MLQIKLLGSLQITDEQGASAAILRSPKGCALLAYLIINKQPVEREVLADMLWDASSTKQSLQNLRQLLARFRNKLPAIRITRKQVAFAQDDAASVDLYALTAALESNQTDEIAAALQLYHGELLSGFYLEGATRFNEWLTIERYQLQQKVIAAYRQLCQAYEGQQEWEKGIDAAKQWLSIDAFDEEPLRWFMKLSAENGQVATAYQQYEQSRQQLWEEFGVEPESATTLIAQKLKVLQVESQASAIWTSKFSDSALPISFEQLMEPGNLPPLSMMPYLRNQDFIGRSDALLYLAKQLVPHGESPQHSPLPIGITGMGGIGKSQLAVEFAYRYGRYFPGGVFWLNFADEHNIPAEVAVIGGQRGMALYKDEDQLKQSDKIGRVIKAWQEPTPRLLIFDNCEDENLLIKWLPVTGGCSIVVTSRRVNWSRVLQLNEYALSILDVDEGARFLQNLAPQLTGQEATEIADELGRLPLALHLAGGFLRRYHHIIDPSDYLTQLRAKGLLQHPSLQGRGIVHSPTGHELNIARTFAISLAQLNPADEIDQLAKKILLYTAAFAPAEPIPRELLLSTVSTGESDMIAMLQAEDALVRLTTLGFLTPEGAQNVTVHRLLSAFTTEQIEEAQQIYPPIIQSITTLLLHHLQQFSYLGDLPLPVQHLRKIAGAVLEQAFVDGLQLVSLWARHLRDNALYDQAIHTSQQCLAICEKQLPPNHPRTAYTLYDIGVVHLRQGAYQNSLSYLTRCLEIREQTLEADHPEMAQSYNSLGILLQYMGKYERARPYLEQTLRIWQKEHGTDHPRAAIAMNNFASLLADLAEFEKAETYIGQALHIWESNNGLEHPLTAHALHNKGIIHFKKGAYQPARQYLEQALAIREKTVGSEHPAIADSLYHLGKLFTKLGHYQKAYPYLEKAFTLLEKLLHPAHPMLAHVHLSIAEWFQLQDQQEAAQMHYKQAVTIFGKVGITTHPDVSKLVNSATHTM